jgi:hypothetical protein
MGCFTLVLTSPLGELTPPDFEVSVVSVVVPTPTPDQECHDHSHGQPTL